MRNLDLSIVVVNWNTIDLLNRCLGSIYGTVGGLEFEVVVVDNGSSDGSAEMVAHEFSKATLIRNRANQGFARANNQAIQASCGRYILLLNSDAFLLGNAAREMVEFMDAHADAGGVGGKVLNPDGSFQSSYADFPGLLGETLLLTGLSRWVLPPSYPFYPEARSGRCCQADWVSGAFLMVRRKAVDSVGLLDEDYFMYTEETDWCFRMKRHGWSVYYLPDALVVHCSGASASRAPTNRRTRLYHSKWLFMSKNRGWLTATIYGLLVRAVSTLKMAVWLLAGLSPDPNRRRLAWANTVSYRYLLRQWKAPRS